MGWSNDTFRPADCRSAAAADRAAAMQRLTLDGGVPDSLRGEHRRPRQFRRLPSRPPGGGRAGRSARAFHERRPAIVATFDPHPVKFFKPDVPPFRLTTLDQREELFAHAGADAMLVFEFNAEAAPRPTPRSSWPTSSAQRIGAAGVVTGDDFTFGKGRTGDVALLQDARRATWRRRRGRGAGAARRRAHIVGPNPRGADRRRHRRRRRTC